MENGSALPVERYRDMERVLQALFEAIIKNGEGIEQKGWNVLTYGSSAFAIIAVLQAVLLQDKAITTAIGVAFCVVLVLYLGMTAMAYMVVKPTVYTYSPGTPSKTLAYDDWYFSYIGVDEAHYLQQRVSDLAGDGTIQGIIQDAEDHNLKKAVFLRLAAVFLVLMVVGQVALAAVIVTAG